jgi:hypothetical protein
LELVTSGAQPVQDAEQRAATTQLLTTARSLSNVRAQPYHLKTTFVSYGTSTSDGSWTLEDISPGRGVYRWTAQGPTYAGVNLYLNDRYYSNQPSGALPLRLTQVRGVIFFDIPMTGPYASIRTATGYLNGVELRCVLAMPGFGERTLPAGRDWQETEHCIDPKTGLMMTASPAPGLYVRYDYSKAIQFHGKIIPGSFIITEGGKTIIEATTTSVTDPSDVSPALFEPTGLNVAGVGSIMNPASRGYGRIPPTAAGTSYGVQVVVVHAVTAPDGHLTETEILTSTNLSLNQSALDRATRMAGTIGGPRTQPGATPQTHEAFFTYEFVTPAN